MGVLILSNEKFRDLFVVSFGSDFADDNGVNTRKNCDRATGDRGC